MAETQHETQQQYPARWHLRITTVADLRSFVRDTEGRTLLGEGCPVEANTTRASWAALALVAHAEVTRNTGEPLEEVLADLLADLRHLADLADLTDPGGASAGLGFALADGRAECRYSEEIRGEL
jgi:hypothetical protein